MQYSFNLVSLALLGVASSHTIFQKFTAGGKTLAQGDGIRMPSSDSPIQDVTSSFMACNGGTNPTQNSKTVVPVTAGSTVKATWRHTLGSSDVIDPSHKGPVLAYLKKVTDSTSDSGSGNGWFKISEEGLDSSGQWGTQNLIKAGGDQSIMIPTCLADGEYLLRAELVALHSASKMGEAQFYMECAQIKISGGSGAKTPSNTVSFPGAYVATDPGIQINIYQSLQSYKIPGPTIFTC